MRVISKFRDYYDAIGFFGEDDYTWVRKRVRHPLVKYNKFRQKEWKKTPFSANVYNYLSSAFSDLPDIRHQDNRRQGWRKTYNTHDYTLGFGYCGRIILIIVHVREDDIIHSIYTDFYEYSEMIEENSKGKIKVASDFFREPEFSFTNKGITNWMDRYSQSTYTTSAFIEMESPLFVFKHNHYNNGNLVINPCLEQLKLISKFHPYTVHQEVEMYLTNDLTMCNQKSPDFGDVLKRDAHGMDEWSFKQRGPKKRKQK